jgi:hypothetical protein
VRNSDDDDDDDDDDDNNNNNNRKTLYLTMTVILKTLTMKTSLTGWYTTYSKNFRLLSTLVGFSSHLTSRFSRTRIPLGLPVNDMSGLAVSDNKESSLSSISESSAS